MYTLAIAFLVMALISLTTYSIALYRLVTQPHHKGLVRTALCRVVAALLYTVVGLASITQNPYSGIIALVVFMGVQVIWQCNSIADVVITKRENKPASHRKVAYGGNEVPRAFRSHNWQR
jgi:hypothetical protein